MIIYVYDNLSELIYAGELSFDLQYSHIQAKIRHSILHFYSIILHRRCVFRSVNNDNYI